MPVTFLTVADDRSLADAVIITEKLPSLVGCENGYKLCCGNCMAEVGKNTSLSGALKKIKSPAGVRMIIQCPQCKCDLLLRAGAIPSRADTRTRNIKLNNGYVNNIDTDLTDFDERLEFEKMSPPRERYGPVESCIYCDRCSIPLTDEHIIAYGLGGKLELTKSSCTECATATGRVEQYVMRKIWPEFRAFAGMQTRRKKEIPRLFKAKIEIAGNITERELNIADHPVITPLIFMDKPNLLTGQKAIKGYVANVSMNGEVYSDIDQSDFKLVRESPHSAQTIKIETFAKMLAKIAHSYTALEIGLGGFEPTLKDYITAEKPGLDNFVGGELKRTPPSNQKGHEIGLYPVSFNNENYLLVRIRLFANLTAGGENGWPIYYVISGRYNAETAARLESGNAFYPAQ